MSKIRSILPIIFHAIYEAACIQLTNCSYDDCENTLSYDHHQIGSMAHLPLFRVRSWNNCMYCMSVYILHIYIHIYIYQDRDKRGKALQSVKTPNIAQYENISSTYNIATWWRHQMETFSALLAICAGNSPVPGEFPAQRPVTRSFDVFFDLRLNKRLSKQSWGWWFETLSCPLWRHRNGTSGIHKSSDAMVMAQWYFNALAMVMLQSCAKPSREPMLTYCQMDPQWNK